MSVLTTFYRFLLRGGPTEKASIEVAKDRELLLDTTTKELRVGDGATPGGLPLTVGTPMADRHIANKAYVDTGLAGRAPLTHQHARADLPWISDPGAALLTAASASAQRTALGMTAWAVAPWTDGTTSDIPEGSRLYFTNARADARAALIVSAHNVASDSHTDIRTALAGKQDAGNYAGSSTPGGAATTALACTGNAATATTASACSGNSATATKLATPRTLTIGSKANTFDGSTDKAWTLAEIGAASTTALTTEATTRAANDNALWAALYAEQTGGTTCEIPLAATGDGSGVLTLRLWSDVANTATLSNGAFYAELAGTTNLGQSVAMTAGQYTTFYIKLPASTTATLTITYGWALTKWGQGGTECIVEAANAPKLNGFNIKYIPQNVTTIRIHSNLETSIVTGSTRAWTSAAFIYFSGNSMTLSGTAYPWTAATFIYFYGSSMTLSGTIYPWASATYIIFSGNSMTLTANLSTSCLTTGNQYLHLSGTGIAVTYPTTRIWPTTIQRVYLRPSVGSMPTADTDRLFIDVDATCTTASNEKVLDARGNCGAVTAASSAARTALVAKGFTVSYNS